MNNLTKLTLAFAAGAATGVGLALFFSSDKGKEIRNKIRKEGDKWMTTIKAEARDIAETLKEEAAHARKAAGEQI